MERFDFDKLGEDCGSCNIELHVVRLDGNDNGDDDKDRDYVYPEELVLKGWTVLTDTNGGRNKVRLFRGRDITDRCRFQKGEPWVRLKEVEKWIEKVGRMRKVGGFNSNGWTKVELNKRIYKEVAKDKMMLLFVKERIFSLR